MNDPNYSVEIHSQPQNIGTKAQLFVIVVLFLFFYYFSKIEFHSMKYAKNTAMTVERAKTKEWT